MQAQSNSPASHLWDGFLSTEDRGSGAGKSARFKGKRILITGAGGYLGSAAAVAVAAGGAAEVCLLDIVERGLHEVQIEFGACRTAARLHFAVGSLCDEGLLRELFSKHRPQIVIHAAALKHVPLLEGNGIAAAATNILGTERLLAAALRSGVERWLLLSTDKAVEPVSVMGATKRVAEMLVLSGSPAGVGCVARLCNVLGSTGSVAPLFARQIARGEAVTVTDTDATRFFMTREEAVACLLDAVCDGGEARLVVPGRAELRRVEELANHMLRRSDGSQSYLVHTQLRAGERLHEALHSADEVPFQIRDAPRLLGISPLVPDETQVRSSLAAIAQAVQHRATAALRDAVATLVQARPEVRA